MQPGKDSQGVADLIGRFGHDAKVEGDGSLVGGEFHGLNPATHHMQRQQDGRFPVTLSLPMGKAYHFRTIYAFPWPSGSFG